MAQQPPVGVVLLLIEFSRSHSGTSKSVELFWTSDRPITPSPLPDNITLTRDRYSWPRWDSNPESQQASGHWHAT